MYSILGAFQFYFTLPLSSESEDSKSESCAMSGISTCWDNLVTKPKDKCKTALLQRTKYIDSVQPTSISDTWRTAKMGGINTEYSPP